MRLDCEVGVFSLYQVFYMYGHPVIPGHRSEQKHEERVYIHVNMNTKRSRYSRPEWYVTAGHSLAVAPYVQQSCSAGATLGSGFCVVFRAVRGSG